MKRLILALTALLLATCLVGVAMAVTVLRPRTEVWPPTLTEWHRKDISALTRLREQITHCWRLYPPREWRFARYGCRGTHGWQYGPFAFQEKREFRSWPVAVEKEARAIAVRELGVKGLDLDIRENYSLKPSWHVVATAPGKKRLEMDFELTFDHRKKPLLTFPIPQTTKIFVLPLE